MRGTIKGGERPLGEAKLTLFLAFPGNRTGVLQASSNAAGRFHLPYPKDARPYALLVSPRSAFWEMLVPRPGQDHEVICPPLPLPPESDGWLRSLRIPTWAESRGESIRIGVIDSGCGPHPALSNVTRLGRFLDGDFDPEDRDDVLNHGTHVCGILAMRPQEVWQFSGVAPGASVYCVAVVRKDPKSGANQADIANAIDYLSDEISVDLINI
ncbi:MAG: S8/S53 family peptidase, partial [Acidobacteria bacterium]|nr:S8/S53 family peptidase [Acidobacteriota bacterium]